MRLCGPLAVTLEGRSRERDLPGRQGRLLFGYLAVRHPEAVGREELLSMLWPEGPSEAARSALNALLSKLKRALGPECVEGRDPLRLVLPPGVPIDLREAERAVAEGEAALAGGRAREAIEAARAAASVAERGFLEGIESEWADERRREVEDLHLRALECLAEAGLVLEGPALSETEQAARALIAAAPFRESGHRLLMEALGRRGNVAEALRVYDDLRTRLLDELGTAPAREIQELHLELLGRGDEQPVVVVTRPLRSARPPLPAPLEHLERAAFVGRGSALSALEECWSQAASGGCRLVSVAGESGVGKTRLAAHFAAAAHAEGATVLYGRCDEEGVVPFQPFSEALAPVLSGARGAGMAATLGPLAGELARIVPAMEAAVEVPPQAIDGDRYRLFTAVEEAFAAVATSTPVLLVLDDLHWADRPTLALVRHLVRANGGGTLMVLATFRDVETPAGHPLAELLTLLRREGVASRIDLTGLGVDDVAELIAQRTSGPADAGLARRLRERTQGNPLFIGELLQAAERRGEPDALEQLPVPEGVAEAIERRLNQLPEAVAAVLETGAVAGQRFDCEVLEAIPELGEIDVLDALEAATRARLIDEVPDRPGCFAFTHTLVRDALYERPSAGRRERLHVRLADALERVRPTGAEGEIAHHIVQAGIGRAGAERTVAALRRAGAQARAVLAYEEAAGYHEAALEVAEKAGLPSLTRCDLLLAIGEARLRAGDLTEAREAFAGAARLARAADDGQRLARAALGFAGPYNDSGVVDRATIDLLEEALALLGPDESGLRVIVVARLAGALYWTRQPHRIEALTASAVAAAERLDDPEVLAAALEARHEALRHPRFLMERLVLVRRFLARAEQLGDRALAAQAHQLHAIDLLESGDEPAAGREFAAVARLARELRQPLFERFVRMRAVMVALLAGRLDEAERLAHEALDAGLRAGARDAAQGFGVQLWCVLRYRGGSESMRPMVQAIVDEYPQLAPWRAGLALLCAEAGDLAAARAEFDRLAGGDFSDVPQDVFWMPSLTLAADACAALGDPARARILYDLLAPYGNLVVLVRGAAVLGPAARALGSLATVMGLSEVADRRFEEAVRVSRVIGSVVHEAHARVEQGRMLLAAGEVERGEGLLAEGRAIAEARGLHRLVELASEAVAR